MSSHSSEFSRRAFLAGAAATVGAVNLRRGFGQATPVAAPAAGGAAAPGKKLGYALVGIGTLTMQQLLPAFASCKLAKPVALVSGHPDKAKQQAEKFNIDPSKIYSYENFDTIKDNPEIDIVYIVLPNSMHAEYTVRAAKAGKHVLCEKPMANTVDECKAMIDACKAANKKLMIAYRMQYEPMTQAAIKVTRDPAQVGVLKSIMAEAGFSMGANNTPENYWRLNKKMAGGGPMMDMGIYALQAIRYLSGQEPSAITAVSYQPANSKMFSEVEESMACSLQFPSGLVASLTTSYGVSLNHARVYATRGSVELEPLQSYSGNHLFVTARGGGGGRGGAGRQEVAYTPVNHFANMMDNMCECVTGNKEPLTPGEEGLRDITIMMAAFQSAREGKTVKL